MKENILYHPFVIDGVPQAVTPAQMLAECAGRETVPAPAGLAPVVDETVDGAPSTFVFDEGAIQAYLSATVAAAGDSRSVPVLFAASATCGRIATALIEAMWRNGHFRLEDLTLRAEWRWDERPIGNIAALYGSVQAAGAYIGDLGVTLRSYAYAAARACSVTFRAALAGSPEEVLSDDEEEPLETAQPRIGRKRIPRQMTANPGDWLIYIPFDTCDFRLGGSMLAEAVGSRSAVAPDIADADYFMDCFEVVRELVEDGIVRAGTTVGTGGLLTALHGMCGPGTGAAIGIGDLRRAYGGEQPVRILFAEVPGVILQVADADYDYVDAELLLQDVAYFPLGHPVAGKASIVVDLGDRTGVEGILESLLQSQASEGED